MVPRIGFEPMTFPLGGGRAILCATGANSVISLTSILLQFVAWPQVTI